MALTADEAARLATLRAAYDRVITGGQVVRVEFNGRLTAFGPGNAAALLAEIQKLEVNEASPTARRRGAIGFRSR
jgi:hypothetical protein